MAAPTFVAEYETAWNASGSSKNASVTTAVGDVLVLVAGTADQVATLASPPTGGTSLTWTLRQSVVVANYCTAYVWTATATTAETFTCTVTHVGSTALWGFNCLRFSGSDGIGNSNKTNTSGAPSLSLTTAHDNSCIVAFNADWNAVDGADRDPGDGDGWRTVNGITPSSGAGTEATYFRDSAQYTVYAARWTDAGTAGAKTVGLSAPSGQKYSIVAVEVRGSAGGGTTVSGAGSATFTLTATASGTPETFGAGSASLGFTGTAAGIDRSLGQAAASLGFTGTAAGIDRAVGQAAATLGFTGTAAGIDRALGQGSATFDFTGTASGSAATQVTGAASGSFAFTATASGAPRTQGAASASFGLTATAAGKVTHLGQAAASFTLTATAAGTPDVHGTASAVFGFTGTASGFVGEPPTTGTASAVLTFTGTALGIDRSVGTGSATFTLTSTAQGIVQGVATGTGSATFNLTATAAGKVTHRGVASGAFDFTATATNLVVVTPPERVRRIVAETRLLTVDAELRVRSIPAETRTIRSLTVPDFPKDPAEKLDYAIDWKYATAEARTAAGDGDGWLAADETISASTWAVPSGITQTTPAPSNVDGLTTIWLSGGTAGAYYTVTNTVTTSAGRIGERSITIRCVDR